MSGRTLRPPRGGGRSDGGCVQSRSCAESKQAYKRAVALNPEISKIIEQRQQASRQQKGNMERARRAASTIKGAPGGNQAGGKGKPATRREALSEAWDDAVGE
jgi:hypothetical protein